MLLCVRVLSHMLPSHLWSPRQHLAPPHSTGEIRDPNDCCLPPPLPHLPLSQWHKFHLPFPCLPGADETLNGDLMKSQGLSHGLITWAPFTLGGTPPPQQCVGEREHSC